MTLSVQPTRTSLASIFLLSFLLWGSFIQNANSSFARGRDSPFLEQESSEEVEVVEVETSTTSSGKTISGNKLNKTHSRLINYVHEDEQLKDILCPGMSILYRYDLRAGKCGAVDTQAHCGWNMVFKDDPESSTYGYCDCDFDSHEVPLVFHLQSNQCYPVYQQAYCRPGDWLVLSRAAKGPICQRNHCNGGGKSPIGSGRRTKVLFPGTWNAADTSGRDHPVKLRSFAVADQSASVGGGGLVPLNGTGPCVALGKESEYCDPSETVIIPTGDYVPRCSSSVNSERRLSIIPNACPPGSYYSIIGYCQPVWDF